MRQRVYFRRLLITGDDQAFAIASPQIRGSRLYPFSFHPGKFCVAIVHANSLKKRLGDVFDAAAIDSQSMIGHRASDGGRAFRDIEPVHASLIAPREPAAISKLAGVAERCGMTG